MKKILALTLGIAGAAMAAYVATDSDTRPTLVASAAAQSAEPVTIWRDPGCGCCDAYAEYLRAEGFAVNVIDDRDFDQRSVEMGVPERGIGCHLAMIDGYAIRDHRTAAGGTPRHHRHHPAWHARQCAGYGARKNRNSAHLCFRAGRCRGLFR